jgi:hypothetical protein
MQASNENPVPGQKAGPPPPRPGIAFGRVKWNSLSSGLNEKDNGGAKPRHYKKLSRVAGFIPARLSFVLTAAYRQYPMLQGKTSCCLRNPDSMAFRATRHF